MILKESLSKEIISMIKNTLNNYQEKINIGLEMELQQNSKKTDYNFNLFELRDKKENKSNEIVLMVKKNIQIFR